MSKVAKATVSSRPSLALHPTKGFQATAKLSLVTNMNMWTSL